MKKKKANDQWSIYDLDLLAFERILKKASVGLRQTLFLLDTEGNFLTAPPPERPPFCKYILDHKEGSFRCRESLSKGHQRVMEEGKSSVFSCHAGMVKVTAPVWVDSRIVAVLNGCTSLLLDDGSPFPQDKYERTIKDLTVPSKVMDGIKTVTKEEITRTMELLVAMANLIAETSAENLKTLHQIDEATRHIKRQNEKLIALYDLNQILQSPLSLDEKLFVILTSLTASQGFGFNRSMLLLLNENMSLLEGKMGVGPSSQEEAQSVKKSRITKKEEKTLFEKIRKQNIQIAGEVSSFDGKVRSLSFSTSEKNIFPVAVLFEKTPVIVRNKGEEKDQIHPDLGKIMGNLSRFVAIPLIENETPIGVIIADNRFSRRKIDKDTLQMLSIFSNQAATAISNSKLYSILQEKIFQLAESNRQLHKAHTRLMQMERFSIMGSVAAGVAHEIKNPLNSIVIYLELLKNELEKEKPDTDKIAEKLNVVEHEIERLSDMATEFLSYSNVDQLKTSPIDIHILLQQVIRFIGYQAKEHNVTIKEKFSPSIPEISLNHKQMKQVFLNIILNAIQAMPDGGELKISTEMARNKEDKILVTFSDTGVGIKKEVQAHVFEPFFTTRKGGTGLGLSFVDKVVRDHGGEIEIKSSKGKGTRIDLYFPLQNQILASPENRKPRIIKV
jgi:signal transduction histidine kinase/ligand-binding sensor protein